MLSKSELNICRSAHLKSNDSTAHERHGKGKISTMSSVHFSQGGAIPVDDGNRCCSITIYAKYHGFVQAVVECSSCMQPHDAGES